MAKYSMLYRYPIAVSLWLWFAQSSAQSTCTTAVPSPIKLPVRNVTFQGNVVRRGVALSVGTPAQEISLAVNIAANNTYIYDQAGECGSDQSTQQCIGTNGGAFDEKDSSTWIDDPSAVQVQDPLFAIDSTNNADDELGTDTLELDASTSVTAFPFHVPRFRDDSTVHRNNLGLGPESTLLSKLHSAGKIASRSWSLFWGLTGPTKQMDGSLVLGGQDLAKTKGATYTQPINTNGQCAGGLIVTVTNILMDVNGTSTDVLDSSSMLMCIRTDYELITIPNTVWTKMGFSFCETRAYGLNLWGCNFPTDQIYAGDLRFIFDNTVEITVPNSQLVQTDMSFDTTGNIVYNSSVRELMLNALESGNSDDMPLLGMTFLSSTYLSVNYEKDEFTLWQANPTTDENIVAIPGNSTECIPMASASGTASTAATSSSTPGAAKTHGSSSSLSTGAIVGIAITAVAVLLAIAAALLYRRKRQQPKHRSELSGENASGSVLPMLSYDKAELSAGENLDAKPKPFPLWSNNKDHFKQVVVEPQELPAGHDYHSYGYQGQLRRDLL